MQWIYFLEPLPRHLFFRAYPGSGHSHVRRHLIAEHNGHPDNSVRLTRICSRTRRGGIPQEDHPRARDHDLLIDAQRQRSSEEEPPQDAESIRTGRAAYVPRRVYEAPTHTEPIALHSRRIGAIQPPPPKAAPKVIFGSKPPLPKDIPRAASSAPAKADIPRKSPPRARSPIRTQSAFGYKAPPRGLNKAEPRSKSSSNPPQFGYIVKRWRRSLKQLLLALQLPRLAHAFDRHQEGHRLRHRRHHLRLEGLCRPRSLSLPLTGTEFLTLGSRDPTSTRR